MKWHRTQPFPVQGRLKRAWMFVYRAPLERLARHLPAPLKPLSFAGFGFWNVMIGETEQVRPLGAPRSLGLTCRHAAYRIYARHDQPGGASVAGLYFLRNDCDHPLVASAGNLFTGFPFHHGRIELRESPLASAIRIDAPGGKGEAVIYYGRKVRRAEGSPFQSVQEAAQFLDYLPGGLVVNEGGEVEVAPARRDETQWRATAVYAGGDRWELLASEGAELELAFEIAPVEYEWLPAHAAA